MNSNKFYQEIALLRELFHKKGGFDDSNAKLDEIAKILAVYVHQLNERNTSKNNLKNLLEAGLPGEEMEFRLQEMFKEVAFQPYFLNIDGTSIFGSNPRLNIPHGHLDFLIALVQIVVNSVDSLQTDSGSFKLDILNEAFGHFVRDNFRNNIEDAQYMTPAEVVDLMCAIAISDLTPIQLENLTVCDPCCGVGSFISSFYQEYKNRNHKGTLHVVGQDKVGRMVRFAKINMLVADNVDSHISVGNSLVGTSLLDSYTGQIDLILTNPPFSAKFSSRELADNKDKYTLLKENFEETDSVFPSELLLIDRSLKLLKDGGKLLVIVPDSVISSGGLNTLLRGKINDSHEVKVRAIIELPAVTFAQAGTRTKTCILYLEKNNFNISKVESPVFLAKSDGIGFEVSVRKGAPIKYKYGENDLPTILNAYEKFRELEVPVEETILETHPSCMASTQKVLRQNAWTPSRFHSSKIMALTGFQNQMDGEFQLVRLSDLVDFSSRRTRKKDDYSERKCISVLHVYNRDQIDLEEMMVYKPKYPGKHCAPGDLIYSKINPRILRVVVIPELPYDLTCSTEFEIMNTKCEISNYGIKLLLMHPHVQMQINGFTAGTSSSHNRIKSEDLRNVLIPIPLPNTKTSEQFATQILEYETNAKKANQLAYELLQRRFRFFGMISSAAEHLQSSTAHAL